MADKGRLCIIFINGCLLFAVCSFNVYPSCQSLSLIERINCSHHQITVYPNKLFAEDYLRKDNFFAEYDHGIDLSILDETILTIPFIMTVIPMVWVSDKIWFIDAMDRDLYYSLRKIKKVFKLFYPSLSWAGKLVPQRLVHNMPLCSDCAKQIDIAFLFSGGLDAVCSSIRHYDKRQLLITICGSDIRIGDDHMWRCVQDRVSDYAQQYGHRNAFIRSNFALLNSTSLKNIAPEIKNWWACTMQALSYTGLTAPILALNGQKQLLIASTRTKACPYPYGTHPLIDNAISFAGINVFHDSSDLDRLKKIETIVAQCEKYNLPLPALRVCWGREKDGGNCCRCEKCLRTVNELLAVGQDSRQFGFSVNNSVIMQATRDYLGDDCSFGRGLAWHWGCIQRYIEKNKHNFCYEKELADYLSWLASVPIKSVSSVQFSPEDKEFFASLWEQSCKGVLNYAMFS